MGVFDIAIVCPHGRGGFRQSYKNHLMYAAHDRVLRKLLYPQSGSLSWQIGFAGPQYRSFDNTQAFDDDIFYWNRKNTLSGAMGEWAREGGALYDDQRELLGYSRQTISWSVQRDGMGAIIDTGWHLWTNRVTWDRHGDWTPDDWDEDKSGPYPQPSRWYDCPPYMNQDQGWPWCRPRIHNDWWVDNEFGVECSSCTVHSARTLSHYPVGLCFVLINKAGMDPELFAMSLFNGETFFRFGGRLYCRYRGRFG